MDDSIEKPHKNKPKTNCFLSCFGLSIQPVIEGENPSKMVINITPSKEKISGSSNNNNKKKYKLSWFSSSGFHRLKSSGGARTVPMEPTASSEKVPGGTESPATKSKAEKTKNKTGDNNNNSSGSSGDINHRRSRGQRSSSSSKGDNPEANKKLPRGVPGVPEITSAQPAAENASDQTTQRSEERIILGNGNQAAHVEPGEDDMWVKRQSFCRKIDAIRTAKSQPGSPDVNPKQNQPAPVRSTSFPIPSFDKQTVKSTVKSRAVAKKRSKETGTRNCAPVIGMSVVMLTLLIVLLWGRVCAILCTCAWLYFVPLLRSMVAQDETEKPGSVHNELDFDSEEYKQRVVLEGFLERRHRTGP